MSVYVIFVCCITHLIAILMFEGLAHFYKPNTGNLFFSLSRCRSIYCWRNKICASFKIKIYDLWLPKFLSQSPHVIHGQIDDRSFVIVREIAYKDLALHE